MAEWFEFNMVSEDQLSSNANQSGWMMCDCGHDCCTCDSECK